MSDYVVISFWFRASYFSFSHYIREMRVSYMRQGMLTLSGAPSTTSYLDIIHLSILEYYILSIFHYLGSPLYYLTSISDLTRNFYRYNAYIYSIPSRCPRPPIPNTHVLPADNKSSDLRIIFNFKHLLISDLFLSIIFENVYIH